MATSVTLNGVVYSIPGINDEGWGNNVSNYLIAISQACLQKTGGSFTLTAEIDFGATYGLKSAYLKSRATNPSSAGIVRLGNTETIGWRNAANSADKLLTVDSSDRLTFAGTVIAGASGSIPATAIADGSVTDAEFQYINTLSSNAQTQLDGKQPLDSTLTALAAYNTNGILTQTSADTFTGRTITGGSGVTVTNGNGVSGNPEIAIDSTVTTLTGSQTLTNKTITDPIIDDGLRLNHETSVTTPASGKVALFTKSDNKIYKVDSSGTETQLATTAEALSNPMTDVGDVIVGGTSGSAARVPTSLLGDVAAEAANTTVTMTIATPCVVTKVSHGLVTGDKIYLTTSGALPTGLSASTSYYVTRVDANTFNLSTSLANVLAGTKIATSGSQSGTHTMFYKGLVIDPATRRGVYNGATIASGYVGQVISSEVSTATTVNTSNNWGTLTSITLTAGTWDISGQIAFKLNGASITSINYGIGTASNASTGMTDGITSFYAFLPTSNYDSNGTIVPRRLNLSATTTYYLNANLVYSTATPQFAGRIQATRVG